MKFIVNVSVQSAIKNGSNQHGKVVVDWDLSTISQEDRGLIADLVSHSEQHPLIRYPDGNGYSQYRSHELSQVLAEIHDYMATKKAEDEKQEAAAILEAAKVDEVDRATLAERIKHRHNICGIPELAEEWCSTAAKKYLTVRNSPEWAAHNAEIAAAHKAAMAKKAEDEAKKKAEDEAKKKAEEAKLEAFVEEWADKHGSPRLRECVASGWECQAIFADEYLEHTLPGWEFDSSTKPSWEEPRNPPMEAIQMHKTVLDQFQNKVRSADLAYWNHEDDDGDVCSGYVVTANLVVGGRLRVWPVVYGYTGPDVSEK
jgi:hypothetical protein